MGYAQDLEIALRTNADVYFKIIGILGREFWNLNGVDPEFTGALMGKNGTTLSPDSPLVTQPFLANYQAIQRFAILIRAADAATDLTMQEASATRGFARTLQAYLLLQVLNLQGANGILPVTSLEFAQPTNFLSYTASLTHISDLLDSAAVELTNGGSAFPFVLTPGMTGFDNPATFRQFNRALSARVRMYQGNRTASLTSIAGSFFNINGTLDRGPGHFYDTAVANPMYIAPGTDLYTSHPDWVADAVAGDVRVPGRSEPYMSPVSHDGLTGALQLDLYDTRFSTIPLFRNEELILLYAESQIGSDVNEVLAGINRVRNAAGLANYLGGTSDAALLNEVVRQRRYSLYGEGHRLVDLRRLGRTNELNVDRPGDVPHVQLPRPSDATLEQIPLR